MSRVPRPGDPALIIAVLDRYPLWSVWWDKEYGVWRAAEDDPDSDLYVENSDAAVIASYIFTHADDAIWPADHPDSPPASQAAPNPTRPRITHNRRTTCTRQTRHSVR